MSIERDWYRYRNRLRASAIVSDYTKHERAVLLLYARALFLQDLPVVFDGSHLASLLGISAGYLYGASNQPSKHYRTFAVSKRDGGKRTIKEPLPTLKAVQRWILDRIVSRMAVSRYSRAYAPGSSIRRNALFHRNQSVVLRVDVHDFFGSIRGKEIVTLFLRLGYALPVARLLGGLCTDSDSLPQGAPTSPGLANAFMYRADERIGAMARRWDVRYTRYADDLVFSGSFAPGAMHTFARNVLEELGLKLNAHKTRVMRPHQRQMVTGVVVNGSGGPRVTREFRRELRKVLYFVGKHGVQGHAVHAGIPYPAEQIVQHLLGRVNHVLSVNPEDEAAKRFRSTLMELLPSGPPKSGSGEAES